MIRVVLADDHPMTRSGLTAWLESEENVKLVGQAADGESAWAMLLDLKPDLALLDIEMPNGSGLEIAARATKHGLSTSILILTAYSAQQYVMASIRAGAKGFVLKSAPFDQLRQAIAETSRGLFYLDPAVSLSSGEKPSEELSEREKEVLILTAQGLPSSETARLLFITKRTVTAHLSSIYAKLGAKNKTEAILLALKRGIVLLEQLRYLNGGDPR